MSEKKEYTPKELYKSYYWLVIHTDPVHAPNGGRGDGCIIPRKYWRMEKPDWIETKYPDTRINTWLAPDDIPLFEVGGKEIRSWRDMKILWKNVKIKGTVNLLYDHPSTPQSPTTLLDEAELWLNLRHNSTSDDFYRLCGGKIFQAIESHLSDEHRNNLSTLKEAEKVIRGFNGKRSKQK